MSGCWIGHVHPNLPSLGRGWLTREGVVVFKPLMLTWLVIVGLFYQSAGIECVCVPGKDRVGAARVALHFKGILIATSLDFCHRLFPELLVGVRNV